MSALRARRLHSGSGPALRGSPHPQALVAPAPLPRYLSHLFLLLLGFAVYTLSRQPPSYLEANVALALASARLELPWGGTDLKDSLRYLPPRLLLQTTESRLAEEEAALALARAQASEEPPPVRTEVVSYQVQPGDTVSTIALRFGLSWETIAWSNEMGNPNALQAGKELTIPPVDGVLHTVKPGDTISAIALRLRAETEDILAYAPNKLANPNELMVGQRLMVPGGRPPPPPPPPRYIPPPPPPAALSALAVSAAGFAWPLNGLLTTYFTTWHEGIDIARPGGTLIQAAAAGRVIEERRLSWSYGWYLVLDHGNGFTTMYAHNSEHLVSVGDWVEQGQPIARVGSTGWTTGPHVHFEVHRQGRPVNPMDYLP